MPWYQCFIRCENFPGERWGKDEPFGFYTHRIVEAENTYEAQRKAIEAMNEDDSFWLKGSRRMPLEAEIFFEAVDELVRKPKDTKFRGATWFKMSEADFDND